MSRVSLVSICLILASVAACSRPTPEAVKNLPAGDAARGQQTFINLQCTACHEVAGGGLPAASVVPAVGLGGRTLLPPTAERLAEDIVLPSSHFAIGYPIDQITEKDRSRMPDYSKTLSKEQVADLAAFLRSRYERGLPSATKQ